MERQDKINREESIVDKYLNHRLELSKQIILNVQMLQQEAKVIDSIIKEITNPIIYQVQDTNFKYF